MGYALWHFLPLNVVVVCVVPSSCCCCCCAAILVVLATHATRQLPMSLASWYPGKTCVIPARCDGVIDPHPAWLQLNGQRILGKASKQAKSGTRLLAKGCWLHSFRVRLFLFLLPFYLSGLFWHTFALPFFFFILAKCAECVCIWGMPNEGLGKCT